VLNLCKPPHNWASSWAGDYKDVLELVRTIQVERRPISHMHYSGKIGNGTRPIDELLWSNLAGEGAQSQAVAGALAAGIGLGGHGSAVQPGAARCEQLTKKRVAGLIARRAAFMWTAREPQDASFFA
jgi:hypothetical protein